VSVLGRRIKELRLQNSMTQMQLAKKLGYKGNSLVAGGELGKNYPSASSVKRLSEIFDTDLMKYVGQETPEIPFEVAKILKKGKEMGKSYVDVVKKLEQKGLINEENQESIFKAILDYKWVVSTSSRIPSSHEHEDADKD
jgi:transcriptional regulator with XRE-family HTH domain